MIRNAQRVIASRRGDDAGRFLRIRQQEKFIPRPAFLEAAGHLQVIEFAIDVAFAEPAERKRIRTWTVVDRVFNAIARGEDLIERDRQGGWERHADVVPDGLEEKNLATTRLTSSKSDVNQMGTDNAIISDAIKRHDHGS